MSKLANAGVLVSMLIATSLPGCAGAGDFDFSLSDAAVIRLVDGEYIVPGSIPGFSDYILVETQAGGVAPRVVNIEQAIADLAGYDVVFVGEAHGHTANHYVQAQIFAGLHALDPALSLSMEQFERSAQSIVDQYLAGEIGEEVLVDQGKAWDHYRSSYRPMVEFAKRHGLPVIAAEVPANMVSCVGEEGVSFLDRLRGEARGWIAEELHTADGPYKTRYFEFLGKAAGHSVAGHDMSEEEKEALRAKRFAAQVSRDDTMAESIARHLTANPGRRVMHINGSFHSASLLGTPERLAMHKPGLSMANVHPVLVKDPDNPAFDADLVGEGIYLLLIQPVPKRFVQMKNINAFVAKTREAIDKNKCAY